MGNLRTFLDGGGDPRNVLDARDIELILDSCTLSLNMPARWREQRSQRARGLVGEPRDSDTAATVVESWRADILEDPALAYRLAAFLPDADRNEWMGRALAARSPHPLEVVAVGESGEAQWLGHCSACGRAFDLEDELVLTVGHREGYSEDLNESLFFCAVCVGLAHAVLDPRGADT